MSLVAQSLLMPRDLANLTELKTHGLSLVEIKISQFSQLRCKRLEGIRFPENTRIVCLIRSGRAILDLEAVFLEENDAVYLVTDDEDTLRELFFV